MRKGLFVVFVCSGLAAAAQDDAIESVIRDQFAALAARDLDRAYAHASPTIQRLFATPGIFGAMVQGAYPAIWGAGDVRFLGLRDEGGRRVERVQVTGPDGAIRYFDYAMVQLDGVWRIDGVWPVEGRSPAV